MKSTPGSQAASDPQWETQLRAAREERDALLDALADAFLLVDATGYIRFANRAACSLLNSENLLGRSVRETFPDPRFAEPLLESITNRKRCQSRVILPQQASPLGTAELRGTTAWEIDAAPMANVPSGELLTRVIIRDVTNEHHLEQVRKDFVANASHELRTPLAIISGYLENLIEDDLLNEPETARRFLTVMRKHTERITRIVEDMLVISKLESGEAGALNIEPFPFSACIHDVLERLESLIRSQQATIRMVMPDPDLIMHGDRFYWTQVFFNLIENALKQNPNTSLEVEIGCVDSGECLELWVSDNGVGIPSADLPHIFLRFFRVVKHHSQNEIKGTGLGLSIVKRAVEAHHGTIRVTSTPGRETRFSITVPKHMAVQQT